jgi:hypothetical protein
MKIYSFFVLMIIISSFLPAFSSDKNLYQYTEMVEMKFTGYDRANCITYSPSESVCVRRNEKDGNCEFVFIQNGKEIYKWPTYCFEGGTTGFEVLKAYLAGDGKNVLMIANYDGASNGFGGTFWTLFIFKMPIGETEPLQFSVEDYGPSCFPFETNNFKLLLTEWLMQSGTPIYKSNYFIGRLFKYENGKLIHLIEEPILMRRNTLNFEKFRNENGQSSNSNSWSPEIFPVYAFLYDKEAKKVKEEPFYLNDKTRSDREGIVIETNKIFGDDGVNLNFHIRFTDGKVFDLKYGEYNWDNKEENQHRIDRIGDFDTRRLYPKRYIPSDPGLWLKGKKITLSRYSTDGSSKDWSYFYVIWVNENK